MKLLKIFLLLVLVVSVNTNAANLSQSDKALKKELMGKWKAYSKSAQSVTKGISDKELIKWMDEDKEFVLVDVREPKEVAAGIILALEWKAIPRGMVAPKIAKALALKPTDTIVFYCKLGSRSAMVAKEVQEVYGYKNVYYLKGGIMGWIKNGHEIHNLMGEFQISK